MQMQEISDLVQLAREAQKTNTFKIDDDTYFVDGDGRANLIKDPGIPNEAVEVHTLDGMLDFIKCEMSDDRIRLRVDSPTKVYLEGALDNYGRRPVYAVAEFYAPRFEYGKWHGSEEMNIELQSKFVQNDDRDIVLKVVGNIREEGVKQASDDGISQQVKINSGVASVADVKVPNPVTLKPYATFLEVEQPERKFIFRMHEGMTSGLFEADGGLWKMVATRSVKEYLEDKLEKENLVVPVIA